MNPTPAPTFPRWLKWTLIAAGSLVAFALAAVLGGAALIDAGFLHEPLRKLLVAKVHREIQILGPVKAQLLSWHPSLTAEHIVIHNPPWMPAGILADIGKASVEIETPTLAEPLRFRRVSLESATFNLLRDQPGNTNWRARPGRISSKGPPLIGSFTMHDAQVHLRDARRHLTFDGTVSALGTGTDNLRIDGAGKLNTRAMKLVLVADPLATVRRDRPYGFRFEERSSGSVVAGHGALARPFDTRELALTFAADGADLKDLYFLIGVNLPDTAAYHVTGQMQRSGLLFTLTDVQGKSGGTDIAGTIHINSTDERTQVAADLHSQRLRRMDLGRRAAGRLPPRKQGERLLSDEPLRLDNLRLTDLSFNYRADDVDLGKLQLNKLAMRLKVDHGVLTAAPVSANFADGSLSGQWTFDGSKQVPATQVALDFNRLQLGQFTRRNEDQPPLKGLLRGKLRLAGKGRSLHALAASADGSILAVLPQGEIRASLAEVGGIDLRALGLKLSGSQQMTNIRCGVVAFEARNGKLESKALVLDTGPVLIGGDGGLDLATETLDFQFRGRPKHMRLRLRTSLVVHGTLTQPVIGLKAGGSVAQTSAGVVLGVLLTPLAGIAAFVDPGRAEDADCATLIASNGS